jgi:hypothetical protein
MSGEIDIVVKDRRLRQSPGRPWFPLPARNLSLQDGGVAQKDGAKESREGATASAHGVLLIVGDVGPLSRLNPGLYL